MKKIKNYLVEIFVTIGILAILVYSSNPDIYPDSQRYLSGSLHDPPMYSKIIALMQFIFGNLNSVIVFQSLLLGFGIIYISRTVTIHLNLDLKTKSIISLFLFLPILQFYNHLLTESISYALSLLFVSFVVKLIYNFNYTENQSKAF